MKKSILLLAALLIFGATLTACSPKVSSEPVLTLSGSAEASWTESDLKSLEMITVDYEGKDGEITSYSGVGISALLNAAGVTEFETLSLVASDGYSADVTSDEIAGCSDCIVANQDDGGLRSVMPGFSGKLQVKDLIEFKVN